MHDREMKYTGEQQKLTSEESHPMHDWLSRRNSAKKQEKSVETYNQMR